MPRSARSGGGEECKVALRIAVHAEMLLTASRLTPHASRLTPHASRLTPHASRLTPHATGSVSTSRAPPSGRFSAVSVPPWRSTMP